MMRRVLLILYAVLSYWCSGQAQSAKVMSFSLDASDLTAQQRNVRDLNGDMCALVRVQIVDSKVSFEGDIIGQPFNKVNEYEVWLVDGSTFLKVSPLHTRPLVATFSDYGIEEVKGGQVYVLVIDMPTRSDGNTGKAWLTVELPVNGKLLIDGREYTSPAGGLVKVNLPYGNYKYVMSAPHYSTYQGEVNLIGEPVFVSRNKLVPKDGHVIILSNPGTHILVMGQDKGRIGGIWLPPSKTKYRFKAMLNGQEMEKKVTVTDVEQTLDFRFYDDMIPAPSSQTKTPAVIQGGSVSLDALLKLQKH